MLRPALRSATASVPSPSRLRAKALGAALAVGGAVWLAPFLVQTSPIPQPPPAKEASAPTPTARSTPAPRPAPIGAETPAPFADALALAGQDRFGDAVRLAQSITPDLRTAALVSIFSRWAQTAPATAATAALQLPADSARNLAWHAVATTWAAAAPADLAAFACTLDDDAARASAFAVALPAWLTSDEAAALVWVSALPSAPQTDVAVAIVARHPPLIARDPELALAWAEAVRDPALRSRTVGDVVRVWLCTDPQTAALYARTSPELSPSEKEDVLVGERFTAHP